MVVSNYTSFLLRGKKRKDHVVSSIQLTCVTAKEERAISVGGSVGQRILYLARANLRDKMMKRRRKWRPLSPSFCHGNLKAITTPFYLSIRCTSLWYFCYHYLSISYRWLSEKKIVKALPISWFDPESRICMGWSFNRLTHVKVGLYCILYTTTHSCLVHFVLHDFISRFRDSQILQLMSNSRYT